jgi:hypothetical protein
MILALLQRFTSTKRPPFRWSCTGSWSGQENELKKGVSTSWQRRMGVFAQLEATAKRELMRFMCKIQLDYMYCAPETGREICILYIYTYNYIYNTVIHHRTITGLCAKRNKKISSSTTAQFFLFFVNAAVRFPDVMIIGSTPDPWDRWPPQGKRHVGMHLIMSNWEATAVTEKDRSNTSRLLASAVISDVRNLMSVSCLPFWCFYVCSGTQLLLGRYDFRLSEYVCSVQLCKAAQQGHVLGHLSAKMAKLSKDLSNV